MSDLPLSLNWEENWWYWKKFMSSNGYEPVLMRPGKMTQIWIHNNKYINREEPGRFMLNLYHLQHLYRYQWVWQPDEGEKRMIMMRMIAPEGKKLLEELMLSVEAVAFPYNAPLLIGIEWASEITEILLGAFDD